MSNCPLCGSRVSYIGTFNVECSGKNCVNYRESDSGTVGKYGSWYWAHEAQKLGWKLEWRCRDLTDWTELEEDLGEDAPSTVAIDPYVYRIQQKFYDACRGVYVQGTRAWAAYHEKVKNVGIHFNGYDYEIYPLDLTIKN
jgi:lysyl-tRNA synthetase class I